MRDLSDTGSPVRASLRGAGVGEDEPVDSPVPAETAGAVAVAGRSRGWRRAVRPVVTLVRLGALVTVVIVHHDRFVVWVSDLVCVRWQGVMTSGAVQLSCRHRFA